MQLQIPNSEKHNKILVTISGHTFRQQLLLNDNISTFNVELPALVDERSISVVAHYCDDEGRPDPSCEPFFLKQAEPIPAIPPKKRRAVSCVEPSE